MKTIEQETVYEIGEIDDNFYRWLHDKAKDGDRSSAIFMLDTFVALADQAKEIPRPIIEYLVYGFNEYLADRSEGDADALALRRFLLLAPPGHRPTGSRNRLHQPSVVVARYHLYQKRDRMSATEAKRKVAEELSISEKAVERDNTQLNLIRNWPIAKLEQWSHLAAESLLKK
jgi:hypothetical protein